MVNGMTVSVGMTTYNSSKYIREQMDSIFSQTILPDEIVICDDCSTDNTVDILKEYMRSGGGISIKIIINENNIGYIKNFEKCFLNCTGDIIVSCDADDVWFPNKVEKLLRCFEDDEVVYAWHDAIVVDAEMNVISESLNKSWDYLEQKENTEAILVRSINRQGFPYGMEMAFRRNILKNIIPFQFAHDEWIYMCAASMGKVKCVEEPLVYYRRHGHNTSGSNGESILYKVMHTSKQAWLDWPSSYVKSYTVFYEKFKFTLPMAVKEELENQLEFRKQLSDVEAETSYLKASMCMLRVNKKLYKKYRGPWKLFVLDILNIIAFQRVFTSSGKIKQLEII